MFRLTQELWMRTPQTRKLTIRFTLEMVEASLVTMKALSVDTEAHPGNMEANTGSIEAHTRDHQEAHPGAMEAYCGDMEAPPEAMESTLCV
jgi:hypothetical protein